MEKLRFDGGDVGGVTGWSRRDKLREKRFASSSPLDHCCGCTWAFDGGVAGTRLDVAAHCWSVSTNEAKGENGGEEQQTCEQ